MSVLPSIHYGLLSNIYSSWEALVLIKVPHRGQVWEMRVWEKKYLTYTLWKALLAVARADFPFTRKKRPVLYKNPATAGRVIWDFLWSNRASLMAQERLAVYCSSWLMRRYTMLIFWTGSFRWNYTEFMELFELLRIQLTKGRESRDAGELLSSNRTSSSVEENG